MTDQNYSIEEILSAVKEIQNKPKENKMVFKSSSLKKDNSEVPKHTLKLIEEAEKTR
tara:strand:- start:182 stop:352 length:171 start_codon:yes stop_codon:yes gene_type:complete